MTRSTKIFKYVGKRLLQGIPIILAIVIINFFLLNLAEGDAVDVLAGEAGSATHEYMAQLRKKFGLDQPLPVQLMVYLKNVLSLDLGYSFRHDMPVNELIFDRFAATGLLMTSTIILAVGFGILLGLLAAMRLNTWKDAVITVFALITYATPLFWVGLMMIVVFSLNLGWFPTSGMTNVAAFYEGWDYVVDVSRHLVLPTITLSLFYLALYTRMMRASMLEQYGQDYVVTARAKGLTERRITYVHVLRNALLPVVTMAGVQVGALIGGSVIVESVFAWPGLGMLAFESLFARDLNLLLGIFLLSSMLVVVVNLIVDIIYCFLDPRIEVNLHGKFLVTLQAKSCRCFWIICYCVDCCDGDNSKFSIPRRPVPFGWQATIKTTYQWFSTWQ